jgi:hypothetical protein
MEMMLSWSGRIILGPVVLIRTVWPSTASTAVMVAKSPPLKPEVLDIARFRLNTTSSAVKGLPS